MRQETVVIRVCPHCGVKNRVPAKHVADRGRCGACRKDLPPPSEPLEVGPEEFEEIVSESKVPVLVDFWAAWCGPCRAVAPEVERVARELAGEVVVVKVDVDRHPELAARYGVMGIPQFLVLKNQQVRFAHSGVLPAHELARAVRDAQR